MKRIEEKMARNLEHRPGLRQRLDKVFGAFMKVASQPGAVLKATAAWCQVSRLTTECIPPHGQFCEGCPQDGTAKCPDGYQTSLAWTYRQTGCWCIAASGVPRSAVCCDCTPGPNPRERTARDCGCRHELEVG